MRRLLLPALAAGVLAGCGPHDVDVDLPRTDAGVAVERVPAEGDVPRHYRLTWAGEAVAAEDALGALFARASALCRNQDTVYHPGTRYDVEAASAADLVLAFHCEPVQLPNVVELAPDQPVPEQPPLTPGQQRKHAWAFSPPPLPRSTFEGLFGDMVRDIHLDECAGGPTTLERVATYVQPGALSSRGQRTYVFIDYRCAAPNGA